MKDPYSDEFDLHDDRFADTFDPVEKDEGATPFKITLWVLFGLSAALGCCCSLLIIVGAGEESGRELSSLLAITLSPLVAAGVGYGLLHFAPRFGVPNWGIVVTILLATLSFVLTGFGIAVALGYTEPNLMITELTNATIVCFVPAACLLLLAAPIYFLPFIQKRFL